MDVRSVWLDEVCLDNGNIESLSVLWVDTEFFLDVEVEDNDLMNDWLDED